MLQPGIRNVRRGEGQELKLRKLLEMRQPRVEQGAHRNAQSPKNGDSVSSSSLLREPPRRLVSA